MDRRTEKTAELIEYDRGLLDAGALLAGMDEAGRGPLAGPVVAACVVMDLSRPIIGVNDSKKLGEAMRERLHDMILDRALAVGVGMADVAEIERLNILRATHLAMRRAVCNLPLQPDRILCDYTAGLDIPVRHIVHGDALSYSVAAASIVAKVKRDRMMRALDEQYPEYGFIRHKGYATLEHCRAILAKGPTAEHRMSFLGKILEGRYG